MTIEITSPYYQRDNITIKCSGCGIFMADIYYEKGNAKFYVSPEYFFIYCDACNNLIE